MSNFEFDLNQKVIILISGEKGNVIGRAEYTNDTNGIYVNYKSADGRATKGWFTEAELEGAQ